MKCPFCQQAVACIDTQAADEYATWFCPRCVAERKWYAFGSKTLWQEFIRTRKALNEAIDTLCWYDNNYDSVVARNTLDRIKQITETKE